MIFRCGEVDIGLGARFKSSMWKTESGYKEREDSEEP